MTMYLPKTGTQLGQRTTVNRWLLFSLRVHATGC